MVAYAFPKTSLILCHKLQPVYTFCTLPEVQMRYYQSGRASMLWRQGKSAIFISDKGFPIQQVFYRKVCGIAAITVRHDKLSLSMYARLIYQGL